MVEVEVVSEEVVVETAGDPVTLHDLKAVHGKPPESVVTVTTVDPHNVVKEVVTEVAHVTTASTVVVTEVATTTGPTVLETLHLVTTVHNNREAIPTTGPL